MIWILEHQQLKSQASPKTWSVNTSPTIKTHKQTINYYLCLYIIYTVFVEKNKSKSDQTNMKSITMKSTLWSDSGTAKIIVTMFKTAWLMHQSAYLGCLLIRD